MAFRPTAWGSMVTAYREFYRRHLPHWQPRGATLFVTFRLANSLPRAVIAEWRANRERRDRALSRVDDPKDRQKLAHLEDRQAFAWWDEALDRAESGPRWLSEPQVGDLIIEALHYRDGRVYDLVAFCVMPNHVHLVCTPRARQDGTYHAMYRILQSLKGHTARRANEILGRQGAFWQAESYDHVVRDAEELTRTIQYVIDNPVKAGLVADWESWPWTYVKWAECHSDLPTRIQSEKGARMSTAEPVAVEIAALDIARADQVVACARMMSDSEPWITLRRSYDDSVATLTVPSKEVYLAMVGDEVTGFVVLNMQGAFVGYIQTVCVAPAWRNRGIGSRLLAFAEARILGETPNVFMCVSSFNPDALRLYRRLGYQVVGELKDYIVAGHSEILLRKTIGPLKDFSRS